MSTYQPLISVLIPSYNHQDYVRETIESIRAQDYSNIEIVVVDDCSTDGSRKVLEQLSTEPGIPIRLYFNSENKGVVVTLNSALDRAEGELIVFFASDDLFDDDRFGAQLQRFRENPDLRIAYANGRVLKNGSVGKRVHGPDVPVLLQNEPDRILGYLYTHTSPLFLQTALIKKSLLQEVGGLDESALADDWLLNTRFFSHMKSSREYTYVDEDVVFYRHHEASIHKDYARQSRLKLEFIERFTPQELKAEGFSNIHYDLARQALKNRLRWPALKHFVASQRSRFSIGRMKFLTKYLRSLW